MIGGSGALSLGRGDHARGLGPRFELQDPLETEGESVLRMPVARRFWFGKRPDVATNGRQTHKTQLDTSPRFIGHAIIPRTRDDSTSAGGQVR